MSSSRPSLRAVPPLQRHGPRPRVRDPRSRLRSLRLGAGEAEDDKDDDADRSVPATLWQELGRACVRLVELMLSNFAIESVTCFERVPDLSLSHCPNLGLHNLHLSSLRSLRLGCMLGSNEVLAVDSVLHSLLAHCEQLVELAVYGADQITGSGFALRDGVGCRLRRLV